MLLEREGAKPISNPTSEQLERELRKLRTSGPSGFATLTAANGDYLQAAGSPGGMLLEKRLSRGHQHFRAFQDTPVVPFEDGTELVFTAGRIALAANEWFQLSQVVAVFRSFALGEPEPHFVRWRDIGALLGGTKPGA